MTDDEAVMAGEKNMRHSHATHDLYNAIAEGDYPEWTWLIQVMPVDTDPASIGFDPLDDTKVTHLPLFNYVPGKQPLEVWTDLKGHLTGACMHQDGPWQGQQSITVVI